MADQARDKILFAIKTGGPQTAAALSQLFDVTPVAVRQQLDQLAQEGLVEFADQVAGRGRPKRVWALSESGHSRFPDGHSELMLGMIESVRRLFGQDGLDQLIDDRRTQSMATYRQKMGAEDTALGKVQALAAARDDEGYMAHAEELEEGRFLLIENHCAICAAATACQGFCRAELSAFQEVLGPEFEVHRTEHRLDDAHRCVYEINKL